MAETIPRALKPLRFTEDPLYIRLFAADYMAIDHRWATRDVRSSYWRLYVNNRDGAGLELPGSFYPLTARRVHFVPAGVHFSCRNTRPVGHFYIHFDAVGPLGMLLLEVFNHPVTLAPNAVLETAAAEAVTYLKQHDVISPVLLCRLKSLLHLSMAALLEALSPEQAARLDQRLRGRGPVMPAIQYIEEHLAEPLGNQSLAKLCHLSPDHFIRRFRQCVGRTPARHIVERRVAAAAQRLLFSQETIDQIAERTGFPNRFYFSRVFAKQMGLGPAAYRAQSRI